MSQSGPKRKLLFVDNDLSPYGGGNCVSAWALQAVAEQWDVTLLTPTRPDFEAVNRHFGTCLRTSDLTIRCLSALPALLGKLDPDSFSIQPLAFLMRRCQRMVHEFDVVVSCNDEFDFGRPGIQYMHYPHLSRHIESLREAEKFSFGQKFKNFFNGNYRPWMLISGIRLSRIRSNLMVTNSNWTADVIRRVYEVTPVVLYPPVRWGGEAKEWPLRRNAFIVLGRLSSDKRQLELIDIIERVRARGFAVTLDIIGDEDVIAGKEYIDKIKDRLTMTDGWARLHQSVTRARLEELVADSRFGLHGYQDEHFGIAVAEMVRGGCIVFVPDNGGQIEIVGDEPGLRYGSDDEAVDKICCLLEDKAEQVRLRQVLETRSAQFEETFFMAGMQEIVADFAAGNNHK
ncbi:MAG: glycosyltransferase family 4 protein [Desulfobulbaceae bacterium]|nr:glycosyltransferase family 4 protein [Desulfobulbaceae bacterium]